MLKQVKEIQRMLIASASSGNKLFFERMIPGKQKVYGVKTPVLNDIVSKYKDGSFDLAEKLWQCGAHEEKIIAIKIIEKKGKDDPGRTLKLFQAFSNEIDNWAVCDGLGMQFLHGIRNTEADNIFSIAKRFNKSKDVWKRRLSLVMVEWFTRVKERIPEIKQLAANLENDEEYYVKKAVVWIRKNISKNK
jgi:3-methyladenine DNA glycosylase AlkD